LAALAPGISGTNGPGTIWTSAENLAATWRLILILDIYYVNAQFFGLYAFSDVCKLQSKSIVTPVIAENIA
jgi:hypothetical protein